MKYKKIIKFLLYLFPWFLSGLIFRIDTNYYNTIVKPWYSPNGIVFPIVWSILYILITINTYNIYNKSTSNYKIYLLINYLSNQLYTFCFFILKNNFLSLVDTIIVLISALYLYVETKNIDNKYSKYLVPYIIWDIYALILSLSIFILN